jgi:hypothetical protein
VLEAEAPANEAAAELARLALGGEREQLHEYLLPRGALQKGKLLSRSGATSVVYAGVLHKPPLAINQQARYHLSACRFTSLFAIVGGSAVITLNITSAYLFPTPIPAQCPAVSAFFAQLGSMSDATQNPRLLS